jgi:hypothetical protein
MHPTAESLFVKRSRLSAAGDWERYAVFSIDTTAIAIAIV